MVNTIFSALGVFCVYLMATLSYGGIAILMGIESACIPLPSELIMPYAGATTVPEAAAKLGAHYGVTLPVFNLVLAAIAGAIGCNLGSEVAYWVGAKGGRPAVEKYGRLLLVGKHEIELADRWFAKRGEMIVFLGRLLPVVRTFIAFPAGIARMNRWRFHTYTFAGSLPWCLALAYVGQQIAVDLANDRDTWFKHLMHKADLGIGLLIVLAGGYFVYSRVKIYKQYKAEAASAKATQ